jgi:predicted RNA-binding protein with PIN domain
MNFLVDGHNLIAQMPNMRLSDADDESKLVLLLRGYAARVRGRQIIVVFDHGVYGHPLNLNGYSVTCHFAKSPQDADTQLIKRLRALDRPREWTLISSDRVIVEVARQCGVKVITSHDFAPELAAKPTSIRGTPSEKPERALTPREVNEWLELFGVSPEEDEELPVAPRPVLLKPTPPSNPSKKKKKKR